MANNGSVDEQSVPKKPILEAKEEQIGYYDAGDMSDDSSCDLSDEYLRGVFNFTSTGYNSETDEMTEEELTEYNNALIASEGYEAPDFQKYYDGTLLVPAHLCHFYVELCKAAKFAIKEHNRKEGTNYEFYDVLKAMMHPCQGAVYYITFLAEDLAKIGKSDDLGEIGKSGEACLIGPDCHPAPKFGPNGGPIVQLRARVFVDVPHDEHGNCEMELQQFLTNWFSGLDICKLFGQIQVRFEELRLLASE